MKTKYGYVAPEDYKSPAWGSSKWVTYLSLNLEKLWSTFSDEQKEAIAHNAQRCADGYYDNV